MKILMIHPHDIYSLAEPWSVRIVYLAKEFEKKGHTVELVYFPLEWNRQEASRLSEKIRATPLSRKHGPHILVSNIMAVWRLAARVDAIHFQKCFYHAAIPAMVVALLRGKHLHYDWDDWEVKIYEVSTQPAFLRNFIRGFLSILENTIPKAADTISVASQRLKTECKKITGKRTVIYDAHVGADLVRFNPSVSGSVIREKYRITKPLVLYLGQLHGGQYVELFLQTAAQLVHNFHKDYTFMIVGDGNMAEDLKKKATQMHLDGSLIFTGAVSHEVVPQHIAAADVCVACFEENEVTLCKSPLKIVEYLASGKAIVASNVGDVPLMLGNAGILAAPGDSNSLAAGIMQVLSNPAAKKGFEENARKRAEAEYNWEVTSRNLLLAYTHNAF